MSRMSRTPISPHQDRRQKQKGQGHEDDLELLGPPPPPAPVEKGFSGWALRVGAEGNVGQDSHTRTLTHACTLMHMCPDVLQRCLELGIEERRAWDSADAQPRKRR